LHPTSHPPFPSLLGAITSIEATSGCRYLSEFRSGQTPGYTRCRLHLFSAGKQHLGSTGIAGWGRNRVICPLASPLSAAMVSRSNDR
jgi:hypothetical protein